MRSLAVVLATVAGVGYAPVAPGTLGTLVTVPLLPALAALREYSLVAALLAVGAAVAIAVWSAGRAEETLGHDHGCIVIDEVAGILVAGLFLPGTWEAMALAFVLFRIFDVWKPFPVDRIDRGVEGGLGVVGDDVVAGAYAGLAARAILAWA